MKVELVRKVCAVVVVDRISEVDSGLPVKLGSHLSNRRGRQEMDPKVRLASNSRDSDLNTSEKVEVVEST